MFFKKVTLIGVGLLGGSLGLALKQRRMAGQVVGYVRREASVVECRQYGVTDEATLDLLAAVKGADLLVFCTPLAQMKGLAKQFLPVLKKGAIITDVGSGKATVVRDLETLFRKAGAHFVGSHPMAGSEKTGPSASRQDLFENAVCIVTPTSKSNPRAVTQVTRLWRDVGSRVLQLTPEAHDRLVSRSSHLPHVVAAHLASFVLSAKHPREQAMLCATGFRDTTRIASGSPVMWRDIAVANRKHLVRSLDQFIAILQSARAILQAGDPDEIERLFTEAKQLRDQWGDRFVSRSLE